MNGSVSPRRMGSLPMPKRRALLAAAYGHGQAIAQLTVVGQSFDALAAYLADHPEISESTFESGARLTFAEVVQWDITVDEDGIVRGWSQTGYSPLMELLGINFAGHPYVAGH